jgi:MOSC domain-containing protein YiiM
VASVISVNVAFPREVEGIGRTGIDKRPADGPVAVAVPGEGGSGVAGDAILETDVHGGVDQAVYAYAREDLDAWQQSLSRALSNGTFGENLTTDGVDVTGAVIGERWRIGTEVELEVSSPRSPCNTFARWMDEPQWIKRFTARALPGAYLRVVNPGTVRARDTVEVVHRPAHGLTIGDTFRAVTLEPALLPRLIDVEELPAYIRERAARRVGKLG